MNKDCARILDEWASYSKYDPTKTSFLLGSTDYEFHRIGEKIEDILKNFDFSGELAVMFAKKSFYNVLSQCKITVYDALTRPEELDDERKMYDIFNSVEVNTIESRYLDGCDALIQKIHKDTKLVGNRDIEKERKVLYDSIESVVDNIRGLNVDLFRKGSDFQLLSQFSTKVHIFETMAECILTIEQSKDGIYLCFISDHGTTGGYFSFIIHSNGNILSYNDRVNEAYQGQHHYSRNGRWMEAKKYGLFPYNMIKFDGCDYKGYATRMKIDDSELQFLSFGPEIYLPIVLSMIVLSKRCVGDIDLPLKYSSALLQVNRIQEPDVAALIPLTGSWIATCHESFVPEFTSDEVKQGINRLSKLYSNHNTDAHYSERGAFLDEEQSYDDSTFYSGCTAELVDIWNDGFEVDFESLNKSNFYPRLGHQPDENNIDSEYIGTFNRMQLQAYMDARTQLAQHMRDNMYEEFRKFGGSDAVDEWYKGAIQNNMKEIYGFCVARYLSGDAGMMPGWTSSDSNFMASVSMMEGNYPDGLWTYHPNILTAHKVNNRWEFVCPITGNTANVWFIFAPRHWKEIEIITKDVPKVVKGWRKSGHDCPGNQLLDAYDPALLVGNPMESRESNKYRDKYNESSEYNFCFAIGFSKRGLNKLIKDESLYTMNKEIINSKEDNKDVQIQTSI